MILLCGIPSESPLQAVVAAAQRLRVEHTVLNQRDAAFLGWSLGLDRAGVHGRLRWPGGTMSLACVKGVYARLMSPLELPENAPARTRGPAEGRMRRSLVFHGGLQEWLDVAPCRVMNRPGPMITNMSKPYQAQVIRRCGLRIPDTLVTNDPDCVRRFRRTHGRVVFKSISGVRSIVQTLEPRHLRRLEDVRNLPTQFQEFIPGRNIRVHVVGQIVFATEIESDAVDYRYAGTVAMRPARLPPRVRAACLAVARALDLPLAGIDLKRTAGGEYYCFEANPSPAYTYYEQQTGQPIAAAIVRWLDGRDPADAST